MWLMGTYALHMLIVHCCCFLLQYIFFLSFLRLLSLFHVLKHVELFGGGEGTRTEELVQCFGDFHTSDAIW